VFLQCNEARSSLPFAAGLRIEQATADELATLPRIGPTLAARIVEDRIAHGPFATIDDLDRVPGLGPSTVREIRAHAVARPISTE
jgi:competence protein ComEA